MFKMPRAAALAFAAALFSGAASAANSPYTFGSTYYGDGYITGSFPEFTLVSSNNNSGSSLITYGATFSTEELVTFNWSYTTSDWSGYYDPAGYYLDGTYHQLSNNGSQTGSTYTGSLTVDVQAGQTFGWYDYSVDSAYGSSVFKVDVTSVVPEPANVMLMLAGLGALGAVARRRKSA